MATKMKGLFKGFKNMFSTKEHEMEIGLPTNVKHLSHIGFDSSSNHAPTWMNEFQEAPDYTSASLANCRVVESSWLDRGTELDQSRSLNASTTSRDESKRSKRLRRKKKAKNPGSPSSSNSVSRNKSTNSKMKSSPSKFRASCAAAMEDTCVGHREPSANELFVT